MSIDTKLDRRVQRPIKLDWRAYWKEFSRTHGDYPVKWKGRLLFRDGWTYSSTAYEGPEWPPPSSQEELGRMVRGYWLLRKREVRAAWWNSLQEVEGLKRLQSVKSIPLQQVLMMSGEDDKLYRDVGSVDLPLLEDMVVEFKRQLDECETYISVTAPKPSLETSTT